MVWKQDLEKLRGQFKPDPPAPPGPLIPPSKALPKAFGKSAQDGLPKTIEDEDALFLSAMGSRPAPASIQVAVQTPTAPAMPEAPKQGFEELMADLRGLKPLVDRHALPAPRPAPAKSESLAAEPVQLVQIEPPPAPEVQIPELEAPTAPVQASVDANSPARINLAAGMAVEVDGALDLRGHSRVDAIERLKDRLADGTFLGWRTLHVTLGPSSELQEAMLEVLGSPAAGMLARYAQAPIPMGGNQAWILYYANPVA